MLKAGVHPKVVQERPGHASIQITLDIYSHVAPGLQEVTAILLDDSSALLIFIALNDATSIQ